MISITIPRSDSVLSVRHGEIHIETRMTDLVTALESIEDGDNGSRPRSSDQMRVELVSMLLSDNNLARCIEAISGILTDGTHEDLDAPAIAAIVDAVRVLARHPEWKGFGSALDTIRSVVGMSMSDVAREVNVRELLVEAITERDNLRGALSRVEAERDGLRAMLKSLVEAVDEADELHEQGVSIDWALMVQAKGLLTTTEGEKP